MSLDLGRRAFLRVLAAVGLVVSPGQSVIAGADGGDSTHAFLTSLLRRLFPHPQVPVERYGEIAVGLQGMVGGDPALMALMTQLHEQLDVEGKSPWLLADASTQVRRLAEMEAEPAFQALRSLGSIAFYNSPQVWSYFGYEGPSFAKGGYLNRGFDDLDWLPDPGL